MLEIISLFKTIGLVKSIFLTIVIFAVAYAAFKKGWVKARELEAEKIRKATEQAKKDRKDVKDSLNGASDADLDDKLGPYMRD